MSRYQASSAALTVHALGASILAHGIDKQLYDCILTNDSEKLTIWALSSSVTHFRLRCGWWCGAWLGGGCRWGWWGVGSCLNWVGWLHGNAALPGGIFVIATG